MKSSDDNMYSRGRIRNSKLSDRFLNEFLGFTPAINLSIVFWKVNIFLVLDELPQKIIPCIIVEWK
jgi:hypothetical protein